ncbi:MAG: tRNA lysidine(34) synthetase TilS [Verrucomicrobiota bacterium JB023]|nr:tRNA lysidine(34) synthetase TilS [Verrucomicrobiota bacterium JB023]
MTLMLDAGLLHPDQDYLLGLSGGRDSVALLHLLCEAGIQRLHLVHLNHQLRGEESEGDARFVRELATHYGLPFTVAREKVTTLAEERAISLETAARQARHQLFARVAVETGRSQILLAHHAEDQAETLLFNLLRGSAGLKGMTSTQPLTIDGKTLLLLRPLLQVRRKELTRYLTERNLAWREDRSNASSDFTRNRLRNEALPLLTDILGRDIIPPLLRAHEDSQEKEDTLNDLLDAFRLLDPQGRIHLPTFRLLPRPLQKKALFQFLSKNGIPELSSDLISRSLTLLDPNGPAKINLPGDRFIQRREGRLFLC